MKKILNIIIAAGLALAALSCTKDAYRETGQPLYRVILSGDSETKISFGVETGGKLSVLWSGGDLIGLWADEDGTALSGAQNKAARVLYKTGSGPGYNTGSFYTDLPLAASKSYELAIYYPYLSEAGSKTAIAHTVPEFQRQAQEAESRGIGLCGTFGYATASFSTPATLEEGYTPEVNFSLSHKTSVIRLDAKAADAGMSGWKLTGVKFAVPEELRIAGEATYSPATDGFTFVSGTNVIFTEISGGAELSTEEETSVYLVAYPVSLAGKEVTITYTLVNAAGTLCKKVSHVRTFSASSLSLSAGNTTVLAENIPSANTTGWTYSTETVTDLSATGTANCYIAYVPGQYSFDATVIGNGQRGILTPASTTYFHTETAAISPSSAELLWQTTRNLITNVSYSGGRISFTKGSGTGNAVIAAKDASGEILWSWHIWCTSPGADMKYINDWGSYEGMDRNLGAVAAYNSMPSTANRAKTLGMYYQWGRKDPFVGPSTLANYGGNYKSTDVVIYDASGNAVTYANANDSSHPLPRKTAAASKAKSIGSIIYTIRNPQTLLYGGETTTYDWLGYSNGSSTVDIANKGFYLWGNPQGYDYSDKSIPTPVKTIYDPCPPGYMVPPADFCASFERITSSAYIGSVFQSDGTMDSRSFFPCCSVLQGNISKGTSYQGRHIGDGYVYLYTSTISGATARNAYMFNAGATTSTPFYKGIVKADAAGIRCIQEIKK